MGSCLHQGQDAAAYLGAEEVAQVEAVIVESRGEFELLLVVFL
jgi:hypothetical protein